MVMESKVKEVKKVFVHKIRAPYLMQEEVIKKKKEEVEELQKEKIDIEEPDLVKKKKSSIDVPVLCLNFSEQVGRLYGIQKKLAHFFVQCCIQRNKNNTGPLTSQTLCKMAGSTNKTVKKIVQRMIDKRLINRIGGKSGKGGFSTFALDQGFIDIIRLQLDLELNNAAMNNRFIDVAPVLNGQNILPADWESIDLTPILEVFKKSNFKNTQFFGKSQVKAIYASAGKKLTASDVQKSINLFAYGLANYSTEEPYKKMVNPGAILLDTLKKGDVWVENKYLSPEEYSIYKIYLNLSKKIEEEKNNYFRKWLAIDKEEKYSFYQKKVSSTSYYDERVFQEIAWEDYKKNLWLKEKKSIIISILAISDDSFDKFESIVLTSDY